MLDQSSSANILYSQKDHKRIKNLLSWQTFLMGIVGQRPYIIEEWFPHSLRSLGKFLAYLYSAIIIIQTFLTTILFAKTTLDLLKNGVLNEITDSLTQVIISFFSFFSTCYWLWNMNTLRKYVTLINENYWHHSLVGLTYVSSFDSYKISRRITIYWVSTGVIGSILWGLLPMFRNALPLNHWYPFDAFQPWVYPLICLNQMIIQLNIGFTFTCGSNLLVTLVVLMLGQFDVLFCSLKNLKYHARLLCGENLDTLREQQQRLPAPKDVEINQYICVHEELTDFSVFRQLPENFVSSKPHFQAALRESIAKCAQHHLFIWKCCRILESLFHPFCMVKFMQMTFQLCLLVFVGVAGERSFMGIANLVNYLILCMTELTFFTVCGELLRQHSVRAGDALWRSDWPSYAHLIRKEIIIFLLNSQRQVILTAGKFFVMDIDRLRSVVMQAFSFLTLLQELAAKND